MDDAELRQTLRGIAKRSRLPSIVIERDFVQSTVLVGIAQTPALADTLVFKGGAALKKVYFGDYRLSEDLDFSAEGAPTGPALERSVEQAVLQAHEETPQLKFSVERVVHRDPHPGGQESFLVRAQFPWHREPMVPVKIEVTHDERVLLGGEKARLLRTDHGVRQVSLRVYKLEETAAEKLRAAQQSLARLAKRTWLRPRARDYYDLGHFSGLEANRIDWALIARVLPLKCERHGIQLRNVDDVFPPALIAEVRKSWVEQLGTLVQPLPEVDELIPRLRERLEALLGPHLSQTLEQTPRHNLIDRVTGRTVGEDPQREAIDRAERKPHRSRDRDGSR